MELLLEIEHKGYKIEAHHQDYAENPLEDADLQPVLVLAPEHERKYGWTTDTKWKARLHTAFNQLLASRATIHLKGTTGALAVIDRWLRIFYKTRSLPFSLYDHSGVAAYLGAETHMFDTAGWDSGWAGWILYNAEMADYPEITNDQLDNTMRAAFEEWACWVAGDTFGYKIIAPDGEREVEELWGFFGLDNLSDDDGWVRKEVEATIDLDIKMWGEA